MVLLQSWAANLMAVGQESKFATSTKTSGLSGKSYWTNNLAAVWGQMTVGSGFNSLQESLSVLGVPVMTKQSFIDTERTGDYYKKMSVGQSI